MRAVCWGWIARRGRESQIPFKKILLPKIFSSKIFLPKIFLSKISRQKYFSKKYFLKKIFKQNIVAKTFFFFLKKKITKNISKKILLPIIFLKNCGGEAPLLPAGPRLISSDSEISA